VRVASWRLESDHDAKWILRLPSGHSRTLGRTTKADFIVDAALISRVHCRLTADRTQGLIVEDLGSTNGTRVNGRKITRAVLKAGDRLTVGRVHFTVNSS